MRQKKRPDLWGVQTVSMEFLRPAHDKRGWEKNWVGISGFEKGNRINMNPRPEKSGVKKLSLGVKKKSAGKNKDGGTGFLAEDLRGSAGPKQG